MNDSCRTGSLETVPHPRPRHRVDSCRTGSLEKLIMDEVFDSSDSCRTGSLENPWPRFPVPPPRFLQHRQLRKNAVCQLLNQF